jgi:hypothetical protein
VGCTLALLVYYLHANSWIRKLPEIGKAVVNFNIYVLRFYGGEYEDGCLLGCSAV